jgi:hypothetical protein
VDAGSTVTVALPLAGPRFATIPSRYKSRQDQSLKMVKPATSSSHSVSRMLQPSLLMTALML